jgi:hypothetical protein
MDWISLLAAGSLCAPRHTIDAFPPDNLLRRLSKALPRSASRVLSCLTRSGEGRAGTVTGRGSGKGQGEALTVIGRSSIARRHFDGFQNRTA